MKRMHDDKFINDLNDKASLALENANNAQSDIDNLASVYTHAKLEISESDMDDINPYGTPAPVSLSVGDTIYENGEAVELTAAKLEELYAANIIILSSGEDPTNHYTISMQRQSADPLDDGADGSARFESFTVARSASLWHWTMNINRPDSTSGEGGGITISCTQIAQGVIAHNVYEHVVTAFLGNTYLLTFYFLDPQERNYTWSQFLDFLDHFQSQGNRLLCYGFLKHNDKAYHICYSFSSQGINYLNGMANDYETISIPLSSLSAPTSFRVNSRKING